jgi:hypothetical protein
MNRATLIAVRLLSLYTNSNTNNRQAIEMVSSFLSKIDNPDLTENNSQSLYPIQDLLNFAKKLQDIINGIKNAM